MKFSGVEYDGKHEPLIDDETFQQVQDMMDANFIGQRQRIHNHYLKSTLYCGECGYRMGPQLPGISKGNQNKYFTCWGRHGKHTNCTMKYIPMEYAEQLVQELHDRISLTPEYRKTLESALRKGLREVHQDTEDERNQLRLSLEKIARRQEKLLEAHFNDAIPVELLKKKQAELHKEQTQAESRLKSLEADVEEAEEIIAVALDLAEDCGKAYRYAPEHLKRELNKTFFTRILVHETDQPGDFELEGQLEPPFDVLLSSATRKAVAEIQKAEKTHHEAPESENEAPTPGDRRSNSTVSAVLESSIESNISTLVPREGIEPPTKRLEGSCSIH